MSVRSCNAVWDAVQCGMFTFLGNWGQLRGVIQSATPGPEELRGQLPGSCQNPEGSIWNTQSNQHFPTVCRSHQDLASSPVYLSHYATGPLTTGFSSSSWPLYPGSNPVPHPSRPFHGAPGTRLWSTSSPVSSIQGVPLSPPYTASSYAGFTSQILIPLILKPQHSSFPLLFPDYFFLKTPPTV